MASSTSSKTDNRKLSKTGPYCENLTRGDLEDAEVPVVCGDEGELGGEPLVYEVGIEDVEFVPLHNLRRRVVEVVVGLVVLVPLEPRVNTIEIPGKSDSVYNYTIQFSLDSVIS